MSIKRGGVMIAGNSWKRLALGAAAGLTGTIALQLLRSTNQKWLPKAQAPIREDPGEFMLRKAKRLVPPRARERIPQKAERAGAKLLALGYGLTFGALFAATRFNVRRVLGEGALLGVVTWAVGYLGWLPVTKLMPPVWKQTPSQVAMPIAEHALFGVATVAGYEHLRSRLKLQE